MHRPNKPSAYLVATTKLQHEWSANRCVPHINSDWIDELLADPSFGQMHSTVKVRLLLAGLLALDKAPGLSPGARAAAAAAQHAANRAELRSALARLRDAVSGDADEWDKVTAAAAGPMDGRLDLQTVMQRSPAVQESMTHLEQLVAASTNQHLITPLEDEFLRDPPSILDPEGAHFVVRQHARVQPLSAGFVYTQATPPPPSLLQAQGVHASTAGAPAAAGQRVPQARTQQASTAAASGLMRAKSRQLEQQLHGVEFLEEGAADLFKNTHQKYGVASAVRPAVHSRPEADEQQQQQPQQRPQQLRRQQQQRVLQQQQQQEAQRPKGTFFNIYGNKPAAAAAASTPPPAAAGPSSARDRPRQRMRDADIDDLFDDDGFIDDRPIEHIVAPSGGSRTTRHLVHKVSAGRRAAQQEEEEQERTPDDLFDDMDADEGGDGEGEQQGGQQQQQEEGEEEIIGAEEVVSVDAGGGGAAVGQEGGEHQASAVKRRRMHVIASDSDDDD